MLHTLAATPMMLVITPMVLPTPDAIPINGATNGKITYVRRHRTAEIRIEVLKVFWASSSAARSTDTSSAAPSSTSGEVTSDSLRVWVHLCPS